MSEIKMITDEQREAGRKERLEEVGTMSPCPFCKRPRVERSDYLRCNPCGINWLDEEMHLTYKGKPYLEVDPRQARSEARNALMGTKAHSSAERTTGDADGKQQGRV